MASTNANNLLNSVSFADKTGAAMHKEMPKTKADIVVFPGSNGASKTASKLTLQPGWRWCDCIKPVLPEAMQKFDYCQKPHFGFLQEGTISVWTDPKLSASGESEKMIINAGQVYEIKPGHDAEIISECPAVAYEFESTWATETAGSSKPKEV